MAGEPTVRGLEQSGRMQGEHLKWEDKRIRLMQLISEGVRNASQKLGDRQRIVLSLAPSEGAWPCPRLGFKPSEL